jgi:hypothetical protein
MTFLKGDQMLLLDELWHELLDERCQHKQHEQ